MVKILTKLACARSFYDVTNTCLRFELAQPVEVDVIVVIMLIAEHLKWLQLPAAWLGNLPFIEAMREG